MGLKPGDIVVFKSLDELRELYTNLAGRYRELIEAVQGKKFTVVGLAPGGYGTGVIVTIEAPDFYPSNNIGTYRILEQDLRIFVSKYPTNHLRGGKHAGRRPCSVQIRPRTYRV